MVNPPQRIDDFWFGFGIWVISGLEVKYHHIWSELLDTYFHSDIHRQLREKWKFRDAIWSHIDEILKKYSF